MKTFTIGEAARQAQVNVQTLRYYQRVGLLAPESRPGSGYPILARMEGEE